MTADLADANAYKETLLQCQRLSLRQIKKFFVSVHLIIQIKKNRAPKHISFIIFTSYYLLHSIFIGKKYVIHQTVKNNYQSRFINCYRNFNLEKNISFTPNIIFL